MSKSLLLGGTAALALSSLASVAFSSSFVVTSNADAGVGSLRQAITDASASSNTPQIFIATDEAIMLASPLVYSGTADLTIHGNETLVFADQDFTLLTSAKGAGLTLSNMAFEGPGNFDITNRADADGVSGKGIFIDVADDATGTVALNLTNVSVAGVANHGIHISDCNLADDCGSGGGGAGEGSAASIAVNFTNVAIIDAGNGKFDADGLRVDERGAGDIVVDIANSTFEGVGADGVELDEGQDGDVRATVINSVFEGNGIYCHPDVLNAYLPAIDEAEYDDNTTAADAIPGPVTNSPDDGCIEREVDLYDSGYVEAYEFGIDVDDGFDIDEAGPGSIYVVMNGSEIVDNFDEGADFDEEGDGGISAWFVNTLSSGNTDDGYKNSEEGEGNVSGGLINSVAEANGGKGVVYEQEDGGDIAVTIVGSVATGNDDSDKTGVEVVQDSDGAGSLIVMDSDIADGFDLENVELTEN